MLEEYFHGYDRDTPHDTRSASKSWTAVLIGAAMQTGAPIGLDTPVYETMLAAVPADLDPRKRAMRLEHLVGMTAGFACGGDSEDIMQQQTAEPDWLRYTLNMPMEFSRASASSIATRRLILPAACLNASPANLCRNCSTGSSRGR